MDVEKFWNRVKALYREKHLTQEEVAKACGRSINTFRGWMSKRIVPPLDDAAYIARCLDVSLEFLVYGTDDKISLRINDVLTSLNKTAGKLQSIKCAIQRGKSANLTKI